MKIIYFSFIYLGLVVFSNAQDNVRARDLGVPFDGKTGLYNAITDVAGIEVGHKTIIRGEGDLVVGEGPVRTGVTAILPRGRGAILSDQDNDYKYKPVFAGWYSLNGNGEMTGTTWVEESGFLGGAIAITNTHSVGIVHDALIEWEIENGIVNPLSGEPGVFWSLPVVAETWDGSLNDINGFHVTKEDAFEALNNAKPGPVAEGNVGGGTGMVTHQFKGGIGTSSRVLSEEQGGYTVGVLVQSNYGIRDTLTIAGVPVGKEITDLMPERGGPQNQPYGSIIVTVATDAPLLPHQLKRIARRVPMGIAKVGGYASNGSGDIFIAFSTANEGAFHRDKNTNVEMMSNDDMGPLFLATIQATEEAIINAMVAAETMVGRDYITIHELPHDRLREVLKKYNRLEE
ncbi:P1 family peptidase [Pseudemcibacter aquimaris]|uniref:DmpA family aminopeptidase n=1 Tax=Pseudemcibacter aquimaris TaxID=2857064 RepID=UPI002013892E|nr:P1 family peptidase [Pseudemcibacter aquimaris]MCC3860953.1 P1 family peptidase [Pseudemcibacter aquimaris]WDU59771.1 P1 family peptidase [Pseudemcibacter aquimaris]